MNIILNFLPLSALHKLIEQLRFSHKGGEERSNEHWAVRTRIWPAEKPNCFDAVVDITYRGNDSPRLDGIELDIAPLALRFDTAPRLLPDPQRLVTEATGQAWVENLPYGEYVVHPVSVDDARLTVDPNSETQNLPANAAAKPEPLALAAKPRRRLCETGHASVVAWLTDKIELTTNDPALVNAAFCFFIGATRYDGRFRNGRADVPKGADFPSDFNGWLYQFTLQP